MNVLNRIRGVGRFLLALAFVLFLVAPPLSFAQAPTVFASGLKSPEAIYPDGGYLYFGELDGTTGTLNRMPTAGGPKQVLAVGTSLRDTIWVGILRIDFSPTHIYASYGGYNTMRIEEFERNGPGRRLLATTTGGGFLGKLGGDIHLYRSFSVLQRLSLTPGSVPVDVQSGFWPRTEVRDGSSFFFVDLHTRNLYRYDPLVSFTPVALITNNSAEGWTHTNATHAFVSVLGQVKMVPKGGGQVTSITLPHPDGFMRGADENNIYYTVGVSQLWKKPLAEPSTSVLLASGLHLRDRVVSQAGHIYWLDFALGETAARILKLSVSNVAPTANAGVDQAIHAGRFVSLNGSASFDDNTPSAALAYNWTLVSRPAGSAATLSSASAISPTFFADKAGTYLARLVVTDEAGLASAADDVVVSSVNQPPTAEAGEPALVLTNTIVNLDGRASTDPDGDPLTYLWTMTSYPPGASTTISGPTSPTPYFTPTVAGSYVVTLAVSDGYGAPAQDTRLITAVSPGNYAQMQLALAAAVVSSLNSIQVTNVGNQRALSNFISQAVAAIQAGDLATARAKIEAVMERSNGCELSGAPEASGNGRDWVTSCASQASLMFHLRLALGALGS